MAWFSYLAGSLDWAYVCRASSKVVTFIDLAGHERYLKTTIFGMTGHAPDFCMLMVSVWVGVCVLSVTIAIEDFEVQSFPYHHPFRLVPMPVLWA